jgi:protein TonB
MALRLPIALIVAVLVSLALFYAMHYMINQGKEGINKSEDYSVVDFVRLKREARTEVKKRVIPEKPPLPDAPPPPPQMSVAEEQNVSMPNLQMEVPMISSAGISGGPFMGIMGGGGVTTEENAELIPLAVIAPIYPRKAALDGKEGWVKLEFTVTELGTVKDVKVIESEPRRIFDRAAMKAILKWKFKPRIVDGKAVERRATQVIDFKLTQD